MPDWLPGFVVGILNSKALSDATGWVKTESEKAEGAGTRRRRRADEQKAVQAAGRQLEQRQVRAPPAPAAPAPAAPSTDNPLAAAFAVGMLGAATAMARWWCSARRRR